MLEPRIQQQFFDCADLMYQAAERMVRPMADAAQALVGCLTSGGRVLCAGLGASAALAQLAALSLQARHERERPGLAALALTADGPLLTALLSHAGAEHLLARQIEALGQPGDVLLLLCDGKPNEPALLAAAAAAQARELTVVALTGRDSGALGAVLAETDVLLAVPHERATRVREAQLLVLHALCDAIDVQLLGEQETE